MTLLKSAYQEKVLKCITLFT